MGSRKSTANVTPYTPVISKPIIIPQASSSTISPEYCMTIRSSAGPIKVYYEHIRNPVHLATNSINTNLPVRDDYVPMQSVTLPRPKPSEEVIYDVPKNIFKKSS